MRTIQRDIVGALIISADGKLLLGKSIKGGVFQGHWMVPGGGIDEGEAKLDALKRELLEETGIDISTAEVRHAGHDSTGESTKTLRDTGEQVVVQMHFYNYIVTLPVAADDVQLALEDDFTDATWFAANDLPHPISGPTTKFLKALRYL